MSVSYTHLDVYKRQVLNIMTDFKNRIAFEKMCIRDRHFFSTHQELEISRPPRSFPVHEIA